MQNVGNSIGDVPSVRLYAPPGGGSSFSYASGGATMAMLGGGSDPAPVNYQTSAGGSGMLPGTEGPIRTANRGAGAGGMQNVGNSIGDVPSVRLHAPPGGASSISFGEEINTSSKAGREDKSDCAALSFLAETTTKYQTAGKLSIRDFHQFGE